MSDGKEKSKRIPVESQVDSGKNISFSATSLRESVETRINDEQDLGRPIASSADVYRQFFDAAIDAIFILENGIIVDLNPSAVRMLREKREAIIGESLLTFSVATQPDGRDSYEKLHEKLARAAEGWSQTFDWLLVRSDNSMFFSEISLSRVPSSNASRLVVVMRDITDRKRAEEALRLSAKQFEANLENTPHVAIHWYDDAGKVLYANHAAEVIYGWPVSEAVGQTLGRLMFTPEQADELVLVMMALEDDVHAEGPKQYAIRRKDGSTGWVIATNFAIPMAENRRGFVCMAVDVSEQKLTEVRLRRQEETFRALTESSIDVIIRFDEIGRILYANPIVTSKLGISVDTVLGRTVNEIGVSDSFCQLWNESFSGVCGNGSVRRFEFLWDNGLWFDWLLMPEFDEEHRVRAVVASARDVTERKKTDEERAKFAAQLQQSSKMEAIGRLAGGVAHDFNNLLTAIKGSLNLALLDLPPGTAIEENLRDANKAAESAARLTRQLLLFSRKQTVLPRALDLNETIVNTEQMLSRLLSETIQLKTVLSKDLWEIFADPGQVEQVLLNLVVNAKDAMPEGGKLIIETKNVEFDETYRASHPRTSVGKFALLAVSDTGCGMTEEVKNHIFEPFFTTKPLGVGTGLGLATTYGAVRQAGGSIEVYSEVGFGTTFRVYFPKLEGRGITEAPPSEEGEYHGGNETVLLVEDDEVLRRLSEKMLLRLGYKVLVANDGAFALDLARQFEGHIDLLFCDVVLPGINGKQVAEALSEIRPRTKILLTSGYTDDILIKYDLTGPKISFIPKPFTLRAIAIKVREVLDESFGRSR
jgi:PAS domain S-box-containing protein